MIAQPQIQNNLTVCVKPKEEEKKNKTVLKVETINENKNKNLSYKERCQIESLLREGFSFRAIGRNLKRSKSVISEEVNKNGGRDEYTAEKGRLRRYWKRYRAKRSCNNVIKNVNLASWIEKGLRAGLSPGTMSSRLKNKHVGLKYASAKSIRKFINSRPNLQSLLFWNKTHKKKGPKKQKNAESLKDRRFIEKRPLSAYYEYGHWEGDFIVSKFNAFCLLVLVERITRTTLIRRLSNRNNFSVNETITDMLKGYTVKSLTLDNDIAFQKHKELEIFLSASIYFCHPYHSWEKGLVENTNRWIRTFVPKRTDISLISNNYVAQIQNWFNLNPRQCLQGSSPYEKMILEQHHQIILTENFTNLPTMGVRIWG